MGSVRVMHEFLLNRSEQNLDNKEVNFVTKRGLKPFIAYLVSSFIVLSFRGKMSRKQSSLRFLPRRFRPVRKFLLVESVYERVTNLAKVLKLTH